MLEVFKILGFGFFINSTHGLLVQASADSNLILAIASIVLIVYCSILGGQNDRR